MLESLNIVGTQVLILFILIAIGFFAGKIRIFTQEGIKCINDLMLFIVSPCVIINAFQRPFDYELLKGLGISMAASLFFHLMCIGLSYLFIRNKDEHRRKILRFGVIFSNCGFMGLPLLDALLGSEGVFYGAGYLAVFNTLVWSYGQYIMAKGADGFEVKKAFLNPGTISVLVGLGLFFGSVQFPPVILSPIAFLSGLNTPVPMLIIGYTMSKMDLKSVFMIREAFMTIALRLVVAPLILLAILYGVGIRGTLLVATMVSSCAPVAAISTMFSIRYKLDEGLASKVVAASTLLSIISMTLIHLVKT